MKEQEAEAAGVPSETARFAARREMGNLTQSQEQSRDLWTFTGLEQWYKDARHSGRVLAKNPIFTIAAVLTLAFGIGANTAIFTLIDALLLRGLPVPESERMVQIVLKSRGSTDMNDMSYAMFEDIKAHVQSLSGLFTWNATDLSTGWGTDARPVVGAAVSGQAFETLGIRAQVGRLFVPADDAPGAPFLAVISDSYWERQFGRDTGAIGRKLLLNQQPFLVIGVTPRTFLGAMAAASPDVMITIHANADLAPGRKILQSKRFWFLSVLGRLKSGVSEEEARAELAFISPAVFKEQLTADTQLWHDGKSFLPTQLGLIPASGSSIAAQRWRRSLWILFSISGLVLLLACVNLASLSLARIATRQKELAMRLALGAKRSRIVRQLLTESLMVSLMGTALGTAIAMEGTRALVVFLSADGMALVLNLHPDWRVLYFAGVIAIGTGLLIGAAPAFGGTEIQPNDALKQTRIGLEYVGHKFRFGRALVTLQVALAAVLLTGSMLFARTLQNLKWQNLGFDRNNIVFVSINATKAGLKQTQLAQLYTELLEGLRSDPQIRSASLTDVTPIGGSFSWKTLKPELWPALSARQRMLYTHDVSPQYFQTLGIKLVRGRDFIGSDSLSSISAGILSRSAAQTLFPGQDPVGQLLRIDETTSYRIVGEVDDAKYASLRDEAPITIYTKTNGFAYSSLAIRAELDRSTVVREVRRLLKATGKDIRLTEAVAMVEQIDRALLSERLIAMLASFFAMLAIVLVAIGVFGTVGYSATRRTSEIGLRLALGSPQARVLWMVMRQALLMSALGLAGGVPIAIATAYLTRSLLYGVTSYDPLTLSMTAGLIVVVTIQTLLPGRVAHSSNLCTEIVEISSEEETAVCNLGSIHLGRHVREGKFDFDKLRNTVRTAVRFLDRVIDINFYPTPQAAASNQRWRPVGLGLMGLQDVFFELELPFDCEEAAALSRSIQEEIYFHAVDESCDLARRHGKHPNFEETRAAQGVLQFDLWKVRPNGCGSLECVKGADS